MINFPPASYTNAGQGNPGPQNWNIIQDQQGIIYVSNTRGILSYDGHSWRLVNNTENLNRAAISMTPAGIIFAASHEDIGYFHPDSTGNMSFVSLKDYLPDPIKEEPNIYWMRILGNQLYFISKNHVLFWDEASQQFFVWESKEEIVESFVWDHKLLLWLRKKGIFQLKPTGLEFYRPVENQILPTIKAVLPARIGKEDSPDHLVFTQDDGMHLLRENRLFKPQNELNSTFTDLVIWDAILLSGGDIALATNNNGIIIIDQQGTLIKQINKASGLAVNGVIALFEDQSTAIWAGLDVGIARLNPSTKLHFWGANQGLEGTVMSVWASENEVLTGTTAGLFRADIRNSWNPNLLFEKQVVTQLEVWNIVRFRGRMLIATSEGVFAGNKNNYTRISPNVIAMNLYPSPLDSSLVYVGLYNGLARLQLIGPNRWSWEVIPGIDHQVRSIVETGDYVWAANRKLSRVNFKLSPPQIQTFEAPQNFSDSVQLMDLFLWDKQLYIGTWMGIRQFDNQNHQLIKPQSAKMEILAPGDPIYPVAVDEANRIWFYSQPKPMVYIPGQGQTSLLDSNLFKPIQQTVWSISASNASIWLGTSQGIFRHEPDKSQAEQAIFNTHIRKVSLNEDSTIFWGDVPDSTITESSSATPQTFPHHVREINIVFSASWYAYPENTVFRYRLNGFDPKWSEWKKINQKSYTGLQEGNYTFEVEAKNVFGQISKAATYSFAITPPWYRKPWAYGLYLLPAIGLFFLLAAYQSYRHRKKLESKEKELLRERETAARLRQIDKLKDEFLANTSHELRTPLNGIIGIAESLVEGVAGPVSRKLKDNLDMIVGSGRRLSSLVDDILDFSRLKSRELILRRKAVDLHALAQVVLRNCEPMMQGKDVIVNNHIPQNLKAVYGDESRLLQILFNLVGNAIKFTEKGHVSLMAVQQEDQILVSISDTGVGIPRSMQQKIFESFEQGDGSTTRNYGGTGLGLTISRQLIELHGGSISVKSTPGKGSTFYFTLPATDEKPESEETKTEIIHHSEQAVHTKISDSAKTEPASLQNPPQTLTARILVVDDDPVNQQVLRNQLTLHQHEVVTASSGMETLELLENGERFDLVLLDIMMPQMSGYEVCEQIRKSWLPSELPVIMLTAKNQVSDLVQGLTVGANDYISKPFSRDEFLARIKTHLNLLYINRSTGRFLPIEFLHVLGKESIVDVHLGDQVEKEVTVMFADIRSYTTLAENLSPGETFDFINEYLGTVGPVIKHNKGFVNQYYGDGIMALFLNSPLDALYTAREMLASIDEMNLKRERMNLMPIKVGIGIHMGPLMMGIIGDEQRMDASVVSDTVNITSRLEGLTKFYGNNIILSKNVIEALPDEHDFEFRYLGDVHVKGRKNPIGLYDCFSADQAELRMAKSQTLDTFQKAVHLYFDHSPEKAAELFRKILESAPLDRTSNLFLRKCLEEMNQGDRKNREELNS